LTLDSRVRIAPHVMRALFARIAGAPVKLIERRNQAKTAGKFVLPY